MSQYTILWVDDDINNPELRSDMVALSKRGCNIIGFNHPDPFLDYIKDNRNNPASIDCIIVDLLMPLGKKSKTKKAKRWTSTGQILLDEISNSRYKETLTVVYTITDNDDVKKYWKNNVSKLYLNKIDYLPDSFATKIITLIKSKND